MKWSWTLRNELGTVDFRVIKKVLYFPRVIREFLLVFAGSLGKRAWNSGFSGGVGKRAWNSGFSGKKEAFSSLGWDLFTLGSFTLLVPNFRCCRKTGMEQRVLEWCRQARLEQLPSRLWETLRATRTTR